jgi:hypothetical protein
MDIIKRSNNEDLVLLDVLLVVGIAKMNREIVIDK